ncbi:MAG: SurA N-terminal domain-containing protein [Thiomicrospira sp.]|uniref:SurA N-terminal domain-containing protein n=1 Tax=Thiomicrospira sp. TaxID=935 RepID=UPI001A0744CD|nr:SurA N-terminal domain-containing protein [Thiomicrospira sp.]MBE0494273.1 SurA N-terminal domain-containing protein [Thiomicrospira sp.]
MLLAIREKVQGWIAWAIVLVLIVPFALWGIDQYSTGERQQVVAEVNGETITGTEFLRFYNRQRMRLQEQFGDMFDQVVEDEPLRDQVLDSLIESRLIKQWAEKQGMLISDQQLASVIQAAEVFQENGRFSERVYQDLLMRNGLTVSSFEFEQRQFLIETQFRGLTESSVFTTSSELEALFKLQNQRRDIDYIRLDQRVYRDQIKISEDDMQAYYEANKDVFVTPEQVVVEYVSLSMDEIVASLQVSDQDVSDYYETNIGLFTQPEMRRARHILIRGEEEVALAEIKDIQAKLAAGEDFAKLAQSHSQDPGSAMNGGDLDFFESGMMVPEFDEVVFKMQVGDVSDVVKTDFGWHLIKLTDISEQRAQDFNEVKQDVAHQLKLETAERLYFEQLETLNTVAYEQPDSLEPLLTIVDGGIQTSKAFSREGGSEGWVALPKVLEATFSDDVFKSRLNSAAIEVEPNTSIVLRIKDYTPEYQQTFAEVESQINTRLVRQESIRKAAELADKLMAEIEAGAEPKTLVRSGVEWHVVGFIERQNQQVLPQISQAAFKAKKPVDGQPTWAPTQLTTGDTVLIRINQVDVLETEQTRSQMGQIEQALASIYGASEVEARIDSIKQAAKIKKRDIYLTIR